MTDKLRNAAQLALEALLLSYNVNSGHCDAQWSAITALRESCSDTEPAQSGREGERMSPSKEWLETRLAIADDSDVQAGVPSKNARPCDAPPGCNSHNCLECNDYPRAGGVQALSAAPAVHASVKGAMWFTKKPVTIQESGAWGSDGLMAVAAFRYCLGRMTYIVGDCERWIFANWEHFPESVRKLIQRDLEEEFARDDEARELGAAHKPLGHDCDRAAWERVASLWRK